MKCMLCGTANRAEALRCKGCGASLGSPAPRAGSNTPSPTVLEPSPGSRSVKSRKTRIASPDEISRAANIVGSPASQPVSATASSRRRRTVYQSPAMEAMGQGDGKAPATPRIFGMLVTYSWQPAGQVFLLREGKNTFGSQGGMDGSITQDTAMSGEHFTVMFRKEKIRVRDLDSTNATQVDGEEIWGDSVSAEHGTVIEAGNTTFVLVTVPKVDGGTPLQGEG